LEPDPAQQSVELLLWIAQSQQRMELKLPPPENGSTPIRLADFAPGGVARLVSGLWFTSLVFSLSTVLMVILSKEWVTSRNRAQADSTLYVQCLISVLSVTDS
jgi:hypothetical protein